MPCENVFCSLIDIFALLISRILFAQALLPQPLHRDIIQLKDDIRVILDQGKDALTWTLPPIVAGVIGILHLFALGETLNEID